MSELIDETFEEEQPTTHYVIEDDPTAEWCLTQIRNAEKEKEKWKDFYEGRYKSVCETCDRTIQSMEAMLQTYFEKVPHKKTATQESYALPSGKLVIKKQEPEYDRDDEKIIEWLHATENERFIKVKETLDWAGFKKTLMIMDDTVATDKGVVPGIKATERPDVFKVELKKE